MSGADVHLADRRYAGESFASEAKCFNTQEVFSCRQFASGMTMKSQLNFIRQNADAIIADANPFTSPTTNFNAKVTCTSVERVFNQFFYNRCRTLYYFTRRNLSDDEV